jgi:phosphoribosylaminoimidazole-succinocarboxamide synthase
VTITGPRDTVWVVTEEPWRSRFEREDELVEQLQSQLAEALKRRGQALADGKAELGSSYKVAKELGRSYTVVNDAIKKYSTTE